MIFTGKLVLCLLPAALTPLWGFLIADGYLNFGSGDKDLFLLVPWSLWALLYTIIFIAAWIKRKNTGTIVLYSSVGAAGILATAWLALFIWAHTISNVYKQ
ncbi:MAG: hypothetical protein AB1724_02390 [Thermodesulfobacteriota bacterium]